MAPFDFNYVQDDLLSVTPHRSVAPVRVSFSATDFASPARAAAPAARPVPVAAMHMQPTFQPLHRDDTMLRAAAANRAATVRYDTKIVSNSFTEILLEFLDRNATLTSVAFIICYVSVLRSL